MLPRQNGHSLAFPLGVGYGQALDLLSGLQAQLRGSNDVFIFPLIIPRQVTGLTIIFGNHSRHKNTIPISTLNLMAAPLKK
jgi:hypothetical protein